MGEPTSLKLRRPRGMGALSVKVSVKARGEERGMMGWRREDEAKGLWECRW